MLMALVRGGDWLFRRRMMMSDAVWMRVIVGVMMVVGRIVGMRMRMLVPLVRDAKTLRGMMMPVAGRMRMRVIVMVMVARRMGMIVRMLVSIVRAVNRLFQISMMMLGPRGMRMLVGVMMVIVGAVRMHAVIVLVMLRRRGLDKFVMVKAPRLVRMLMLVMVMVRGTVRMLMHVTMSVVDQARIGSPREARREKNAGNGARADTQLHARAHSHCEAFGVSWAIKVRKPSSAARCSASFFERPRPRASSCPETPTVTSNVLAWSGPSSATTA